MAITWMNDPVQTLWYNDDPVYSASWQGGNPVFESAKTACELHLTLTSELSQNIYLYAPNSTWDSQITIPDSTDRYFMINWGDGTDVEYFNCALKAIGHSYASAGSYVVKICARKNRPVAFGMKIVAVWMGVMGEAGSGQKAKTFPQLTKVVVGSDGSLANQMAFQACTGLTEVAVAADSDHETMGSQLSIKPWGANLFTGCTAMQRLIVNAATPPTLSANAIVDLPAECDILVPADSVAAYQAASGWSDRAAHIQAKQ